MTVRVDDGGGPASVRQRQQVKVLGNSSTQALVTREPQKTITMDSAVSGCSADDEHDEPEPMFWSRGEAVRAASTRATTCTASPAGDGTLQLDNLSQTVLLRLSASQTGREERLQRHQTSQDIAEGGWDGCLKVELDFPSAAPGFPCMAPTVTGGVNDHGRQKQEQQEMNQQQQQQQQGSDQARLQLHQQRQHSAQQRHSVQQQQQHRAVLRRCTTSELARRQVLAMKKLAESEQSAAASRHRCAGDNTPLPPCGSMSARLPGGSSGSRGKGRHCDCNGVATEAEAPMGMFSMTLGVSFTGFRQLDAQQQQQLNGYSLGSSSFGGITTTLGGINSSSRTSPATPLRGHSMGSDNRSVQPRAAHPEEGSTQKCVPVLQGDDACSGSDAGRTLAPPRAEPACQAGAAASPSGIPNSRAEAPAAPCCSHHRQLQAAPLKATRTALQYTPVAPVPTAAVASGEMLVEDAMGWLAPVSPGTAGSGLTAVLSVRSAAANDLCPAKYLYPAAHPESQGGVSWGGAGSGSGVIEAGAICVMALTCLCSLVAVYLFSVGRGQVEELMAAHA